MINDYQYLFVFNLTAREVIINILLAMICGFIISYLYRKTYKGVSYSASFANSIIMLTMITALVIMVIGNNLARAFGLVGAMSIIRFRTAVKDTQDIMFIFFALAVGLASGVSYYSLAIIGTLLIGLVVLIIYKSNISSEKNREFLLQILCLEDANNESNFSSIFDKYCRNYKIVNVKAVGEGQNAYLELSFYVNLRKEEKSKDFVAELKQMEGIKQVNLFFDEE